MAALHIAEALFFNGSIIVTLAHLCLLFLTITIIQINTTSTTTISTNKPLHAANIEIVLETVEELSVDVTVT